MELPGGISSTANQEAAKQVHLSSGTDRKRKTAGRKKDGPKSLLQTTDEAELNEAQHLIEENENQVKKANSVLSDISPTRMEKLQSVNQRIDEGFYDQREVLESVAEKLLLMFRRDELDEA